MTKKFKHIKFLLLLFLLYCCYYGYIKWWGYPLTKYSPKWINDDDFTGSKNSIKKILLWTNYFKTSSTERIKELNQIQHCSKKCLYISDRNKISNANAILFHSNANNLDMNDLPSIRHQNQNYIFFTRESPPKAAIQDYHQVWKYFPKNFFNLTMTFRRDSDIIAGYDEFIKITSDTSKAEIYSWEEVENAVSKKNKYAVQFVSMCYSDSGREGIIREISGFLEIDQFGYCTGRKCDKKCEQNFIGDYYFYLAFENNICTDYVSEKFWRIKKLIVPVVLQRSITSKIAPNNSFIAVDDYKTIKELTNYLKYLTTNETAYLEYFQWTKIYSKKEFSWKEAYCSLCARINNETLPNRVYYDIYQWFYPSDTCKVKFLNVIIEFLILWIKTLFLIITVIFLLIIVIFKIKR